MNAPKPTLIVNPPSDEGFVAFAHEQLGSGLSTARQLESALRTRYPLAMVRERALAGEPAATWYVYREGKWVPSET